MTQEGGQRGLEDLVDQRLTDNTGGITRGHGRRRATRNVTEERDNRTTRTNGNPAQNPTIEEVDMTQDAPAHNMSQSSIIP